MGASGGGFAIDQPGKRPLLGWQLKMANVALREALASLPSLRGLDVLLLGTVSSTNDRARDHCQRRGKSVLLLAERQTAGRGSHGRKWLSDTLGNIYLSIGLANFSPKGRLERQSEQLARAIAEKFHTELSIPLCVKPPNDLLLNGGKVAGILIDSFPAISTVVIGIGMNLTHTPKMQARCTQRIASLNAAASVPEEKIVPLLAETTLAVCNGSTPRIPALPCANRKIQPQN
jgi:biotin-[acetyl-CoA-carboxylase] ligase BirA-like protein